MTIARPLVMRESLFLSHSSSDFRRRFCMGCLLSLSEFLAAASLKQKKSNHLKFGIN
jgi:hypothetical protein